MAPLSANAERGHAACCMSKKTAHFIVEIIPAAV